MTVKVNKWGNSLAVRIPSHLVKDLDIKPEQDLEITIEEGKIVLDIISTPQKLSIEELIGNRTREDRYDESDEFSDFIGKEVW